jgi:hypothetical protein
MSGSFAGGTVMGLLTRGMVSLGASVAAAGVGWWLVAG